MYVSRILFPVQVLGPGNRIGIWTLGCEHHCIGCSNPELWNLNEKFSLTKAKFSELIYSISDKFRVDGVTITGGDPFFDPEGLSDILDVVESISNDILVYTGYKYEYLANSLKYSNLLSKIAVLIDGKYEENLNNGALLRGSSNQRIIILNKEYSEYYKSFLETKKTNEIQNFLTKEGFISVGIHNPDYNKNIDEALNSHDIKT